jgi:hypothetical protein
MRQTSVRQKLNTQLVTASKSQGSSVCRFHFLGIADPRYPGFMLIAIQHRLVHAVAATYLQRGYSYTAAR